MIKHQTNFSERSGQRKITFHLDEQSGLNPTWLIDFFEKAVVNGQRFTSGETLQVGWMVVMVKENETSELEILEPQFDSIPIKWIRGVNNTIRHLILQKSVADLFHVEPEFPSLRQAGLASQSFLIATASSDFRMIRGASKANDSGWSFDTPSQPDDAPEFRSLFELSFHRMGIVPFLALPAGAIICRNTDCLVIEVEGKTMTSLQNDFLRKLSESPIWV